MDDPLKSIDRLFRDNTPRSVDSQSAAALVGISIKTLRRLRRLGVIPSFSIPSRTPGKTIWRYPLEDLCAYAKRGRHWVHAWDPHGDTIPAIVVAKLLGTSRNAVYRARERGSLKGYDATAIRNYMLRIGRTSIVGEIRRKFEKKLSRLREEVRRWRRLAQNNHCHCCRYRNP